MKVTQRRAVLAAGLFALGASVPAALSAQASRTQQPGPDTPRLLVGTFRAATDADAKLGVEAAEALRTRVQQENPVRTLWVLSRADINNYLTQSGYKADSALSIADLQQLAKLMRADEIVDGVISRNAAGVHVEPRLVLARDVSLVQPLPAVDAKNAGDAARSIEKALGDARKQLVDNRACENSLREQKYDDAIVKANAAIAKYPSSTLGRLCLMTAYSLKKSGPDSIIRVATEVRKIDPRSRLALGNLVAAYKEKGDTAGAVQASLDLWKADPSNTGLIQGLINELVQMKRPDIALPIVDTLIHDNPGDPQFIRTKFLLLAASNRWKPALAAGEEWLKADSAAATADLFTRLVAIAASDSQPQLAAQYAARSVQKFPNDASLHMLYAVTLRRSGQLQQAVAEAERAVTIDPKVENGYPTVIVTWSELGRADSAGAWAQKAIAAGYDKATIGNAMIAMVQPAVKKAQETKARADWQAALTSAQAVDAVAPSATTKFYIAVSSFQVGFDALQGINKTKSCDEAKLAEDMWATAQINMPQGAAVDKNTAGSILGAIQQYSSYISQAKKSLCKGK